MIKESKRLDELCDFINGGAWNESEYTDSGIPVLKVSNLKANTFSLDAISYLALGALERYKKHELKKDDLVIATVGSHQSLINSAAGRTIVITSEIVGYLLNQNAVCVRSKDTSILDQKYLTYLCESGYFRNYIQTRGKGAANQMRIAIGDIKSFPVPSISLPTQQKIAHILSAYDDLIENNLKRIKLLEEMAQITYEEWFVRMKFPGHKHAVIDSETGLPEGWVNKSFGSIFNINNGYAFKSGDYVGDGVPILRTRDYSQTKWINIHQPIYISKELSDKYTKYYVQEYDLMLIMVGASIGSYGVVLPKDKGALQNQNQWAIRTNKGFENYMFFKLLMMERLIHNLLLRKTGAARDFFRASFLKELEVLIPDSKIIDNFNQIIEPVFKGINNLHIQNQLLKEARDILLPRLMTGMIDVNTLDLPEFIESKKEAA